MDEQSVLGRAEAGQLFTDPYPYIVIENALPVELYQALDQSFPDLEKFRTILHNGRQAWPQPEQYDRAIRNLGQANKRVNLPYVVTSSAGELPEPWPAFLAYHTSPAFVDDLAQVFGGIFSELFPDFSLTEATIGRRWLNEGADLALDALLAINTPATEQGSVKPPHTDNNDKLIAGLLYFADPEDCGGGDLIIHRRHTPPTRKDTKWPAAADIEEVRRIPYRANTLVLLVNSAWSVHGTSARRPTKYPRRFVNLVAQTRKPLFNPPSSFLGMRLPSALKFGF